MRFLGALARLAVVVLLVVGLTLVTALPVQASSGDQTTASSSQSEDQSLLDLVLDWVAQTADSLRNSVDPNN